jgi:TrmH family RNA methyltransferase
VLLPPGAADAFAPKVLRSAMGAHFRLPILSLEWPEIEAALKPPAPAAGLNIYLADAKGEIEYTQADFRSPAALLIGGEAAGAGSQAAQLADQRVHIPMPGGSESLNAAIAAAILMFEVVRQRGDVTTETTENTE